MTAIGIDAGASRTTGILIDASGAAIARSGGGGANLSITQPAIVARNLETVLLPLLAQADVRAICVGAAGAGRPERVEQLTALLRPVIPPTARLIVVHDGRVALRAATVARPAMVIIAGTGSLAYGERADGTSARAGGYGAVIGDAGSAYAIGRAALAHVARALDGVEEAGELSKLFEHMLDARTSADLSRRFNDLSQIEEVARLAMLVGQAHAAGDPIARGIIEEQGALLGTSAAYVADSIRERDRALPIALCGGAVEAVPLLADAVTRGLAGVAPYEIVRSKIDGAMGAAHLALEALQHV